MSRLRSLAGRIADFAAYWLDCAASLGPAERIGEHAVAVYFHGIVHEHDTALVDPQEGVTPEFLLRFVRATKLAGYTFVAPDTLTSPDRPPGRLAVLTSDDGYASIERLLPLLELEGTPLAVFLCSEHSRSGRLYWWDQLHIARWSDPGLRERLKHHVRSLSERNAMLERLGLDPSARTFDESHRVLSPSDIHRLGRNHWLCFGNHTRHHLSLPLLSDTDLAEEIEGAGRAIEEWLGTPIRHFAFPFGDYDDRSLAQLRASGYRIAFTTLPGRFPLPPRLGTDATHLVPRYRLRGDRSVGWQVRIMTRGVGFGSRLRSTTVGWLRRVLRGPGARARV